MKIAISVPDPIFEAAETVCRRLGVPRSRFYARAIEAYLRSFQADEIRETLDEVYAAEAPELDPGLERLQAEALREDW